MTTNQFKGSRILLVEDEDSFAMGIIYNLKEEGYLVQHAENGKKALELFDSNTFDLIILDIMLPFLDGFEVAEAIREKDVQIPILMLTARSGLKDRIRGLEIGVDDYMIKPFHLDELLLRVKGMLKRKQWYEETDKTPNAALGGYEINFNTFECRSDSNTFRLTFHEAMLLKYMMQRQDKILSRRELLEQVWQIYGDIETRTVDIFISRLRKYFEPDPAKPVYFKSIRSAGYCLSGGRWMR